MAAGQMILGTHFTRINDGRTKKNVPLSLTLVEGVVFITNGIALIRVVPRPPDPEKVPADRIDASGNGLWPQESPQSHSQKAMLEGKGELISFISFLPFSRIATNPKRSKRSMSKATNPFGSLRFEGARRWDWGAP